VEPLTNRNFSCIKVFDICPSPRATGGDWTHNLQITSQDSCQCGYEMRTNYTTDIHDSQGYKNT
jgi:hypothetical protein